jgi:hypothetical protein
MKGIGSGWLQPPKPPAYDSRGRPLAMPLSGLFMAFFLCLQSATDFFRFNNFMKGHETAAGAPFGGGRVSFRGVGAKPPLKGRIIGQP